MTGPLPRRTCTVPSVCVCACVHSDGYKAFADLFSLSTYLVPRQYSPQLTQRMQRSLSVVAMGQRDQDELDFDEYDDEDDDDDSADQTTKNLLKLHIY